MHALKSCFTVLWCPLSSLVTSGVKARKYLCKWARRVTQKQRMWEAEKTGCTIASSQWELHYPIAGECDTFSSCDWSSPSDATENALLHLPLCSQLVGIPNSIFEIFHDLRNHITCVCYDFLAFQFQSSSYPVIMFLTFMTADVYDLLVFQNSKLKIARLYFFCL